ncbi:MAG: acyltransferase [Blautia sp.]|uniref:acyltransferase n=1 Tax=Blautia sp. TaxID=1955243 RepID=UPI0039921FDF
MRIKDKIIDRIREILTGGANIEKLKKRGLKVGNNLWLGYGVSIDWTFCELITIGNNCTITSKVHILAHDASTKKHLGYTKIGRVNIGDNVFIGVSTIILPNVQIGDNSIIASGSVVTRNVPMNEVWGGNPAKKICSLDEYLNKHSSQSVITQEDWADENRRKNIIDSWEKNNSEMKYIE